jgi:hypothetical protein
VAVTELPVAVLDPIAPVLLLQRKRAVAVTELPVAVLDSKPVEESSGAPTPGDFLVRVEYKYAPYETSRSIYLYPIFGQYFRKANHHNVTGE